MHFYSPLRYPGGKGKLADFIKAVYQENELVDGYYIEPYAGGCGVALSLLFNMYASRIIINDLDKSIYAFWHSVLNNTEELCKRITDIDVTTKNWRIQRDIQYNKEKVNLIDLGFSTFYLNRVNRSGIVMGGIIGGINQNGPYKIDARFNKAELIRRIEKIARHRSKIELFNLDTMDLINHISSDIPEKSLIYFDPPYYKKGKDLYVNHYSHDDHIKVSELIKKLRGCSWIVSYDNNDIIKSLYKEYRCIEYSINYSTTESKKGNEVVFFDNELKIPHTSNPMKYKLKNNSYRQVKMNFS